MHEDFTVRKGDLHVPPAVRKDVLAQVENYQQANNRHMPPTHQHSGSSSERSSVGLPGHCAYCAVVGHVVAHPDYGCDDVHCDTRHEEVA